MAAIAILDFCTNSNNSAFFKRAYRYGFTTKIMEVTSLLDDASKDLFCNMQKAHHCLFGIPPADC